MVDDDQERGVPRILLCAHTLVPGPSGGGTRLNQLISAFSDELDVDALTLKGDDLGHIQRLGAARVLRVPVGKKSFLDGLASFQRALTRQLAGDTYDFVYCADVFSAEIAAAFKDKQGFTLHVELDDLPALSFEQKYDVDGDDRALKKRWRAAQKAAFNAADRIIVMSRFAARAVAEHVDPGRVDVIGRAVDRKIFYPPTVELNLSAQRTVAVFERRGPKARITATLSILNELSRKTRRDEVRLVLLGARGAFDARLETELRRMEIRDRVEFVEIDTAVRLAAALSSFDVVVVPSSAESDLVPFAIPHRALEAMACGRATVITGPESAFLDVVTPNEHAVIVPPRSPSDVATQVLSLLEDDKRRTKLAAAGEQRVAQTSDLAARNLDFAKSLSNAIGVSWTPRLGESTTASSKGDDEESRHDAIAAEARRERTVTSVRIADAFAQRSSVSNAVWATDDDVIEISASAERPALYPSDVVTAAARELDPAPDAPSPPPPRVTSSDAKTIRVQLGSEPDVRPVPGAPDAPSRPFFGEPSTESGAYMGAPRGQPLNLPHFAKAFQVPGPADEMLKGSSASKATIADDFDSEDDPLMPAPARPRPYRTAEATRVASKLALGMVASERDRMGREPTVEMSSAAMGGPASDEWAADTVADATPFDVKETTPTRQPRRPVESSLKTQDRGLLVERDAPDVTLEDPLAASSGEDSPGTR